MPPNCKRDVSLEFTPDSFTAPKEALLTSLEYWQGAAARIKGLARPRLTAALSVPAQDMQRDSRRTSL